MESAKKVRSVYVIEDDLELSTVIDRVIKSIDPTVKLDWSTTAEEAITAIELAGQTGKPAPYDLIIADFFLDGSQSGLDFWRLCKKHYPNIPVVLTSGTPLQSLVLDEELPDFPIFLQKPFSINECKRLFQGLLEERNRPPPAPQTDLN